MFQSFVLTKCQCRKRCELAKNFLLHGNTVTRHQLRTEYLKLQELSSGKLKKKCNTT